MGITLFCQNSKEKLYTFPPSLPLLPLSPQHAPHFWLKIKIFLFFFFLFVFKGMKREREGPSCFGSVRLQFHYIKEMIWNSQIYSKNPQCLFRTGVRGASYLHMLSCEFTTCIILRCLMSDSNRNGIKLQTMTVMKLRNNEIGCKSKAVWLNQIVYPTIQFLSKRQQLEIKLS